MRSADIQAAAERMQVTIGRLEFKIQAAADSIGHRRAAELRRTADNVSRWVAECEFWNELEGAQQGVRTFAGVVREACGR